MSVDFVHLGVRLIKSLQIRELWEQLEPATVTELLIKKLDSPRIANFPGDKVFHFTVRTETDDSLWFSFKSHRQLTTRLVFLLEDEKLYQYAFFTDNPRKVGPMYETRILLGFKSSYRRSAKRIFTVGSNLLIRGLLVANDEINIKEKAPVAKVLLQSYERMLQQSFGDIQVSFYPDISNDPVLERLKSKGEGYFISDINDYESFYQGREVQSDKYNFKFTAPQNFYDEEAQERLLLNYRNKGIKTDLYMPIILHQKNGDSLNIGYIRKTSTRVEDEDYSHKFFYGIQNTLQAIETSLTQSSIKTLKCEVPLLDASFTGVSFYMKDREIVSNIMEADRSRVIIGMAGFKRALIMSFQKVYNIPENNSIRFGVKIDSLQLAKPESEMTGETLWRQMIQKAGQS